MEIINLINGIFPGQYQALVNYRLLMLHTSDLSYS